MNKKTVFLISALLPAPFAFSQQLRFSEMLGNAGIAIIPIIGLSVMALAVTIERFRRCRKEAIVPDGLLEQITPYLHKSDYRTVEQRLGEEDNVLGRVLLYVVMHRRRDERAVSDGAGDLASVALREHLQRIYPLAVTATVSPIIGLLGTVVGMIEAFHAIAFSGAMGDPALLAGGISKALVNTAAGLSVALPSLLAYHFFRNRITGYGIQLEKAVNQVMTELFMAADPDRIRPDIKVVNHAD